MAAFAAPLQVPRRHSRMAINPRARLATRASADPPPTPSDWRAFRAQLVRAQNASPAPAPGASRRASFAHALPNPERGALLLASPAHFSEAQTYFRRAAILLFAHDARGTAGLLLTRGEDGSVRAPAGLEGVQVRSGGDVGEGSLFALQKGEGEGELLPGVRLCNAEEAMQKGGDKGDVKLYTKYCGWGPGQLEAEMLRGVWVLAAVSGDYVMDVGAEEIYGRVMRELGVEGI